MANRLAHMARESALTYFDPKVFEFSSVGFYAELQS